MKERPILFNGDMVRAILHGHKTQTRRPVMPQPVRTPPGTTHGWEWERHGKNVVWIAELHLKHCPFGQPGDRLWVRETFAEICPSCIVYLADDDTALKGTKHRWTPSIHMPRRLSRITLEITSISVERVQQITNGGAFAEGVEDLGGNWGAAELYATAKRYCLSSAEYTRNIFVHLWDTLYVARGLGWAANPWVWVVGFKRLEEH